MENGAWLSHLIQCVELFLLVAGDKTGGSQKKFYRRLIEKADARFNRHLEKLKAGAESSSNDENTSGKIASIARQPKKEDRKARGPACR
jgi:hypothetical protein